VRISGYQTKIILGEIEQQANKAKKAIYTFEKSPFLKNHYLLKLKKENNETFYPLAEEMLILDEELGIIFSKKSS